MSTHERIERTAEAAQSSRTKTAWAEVPDWSRDHWRQIARAALLAAAPTADEHERGIEAALRAQCASVCSYCTPQAPAHGCDGECRRQLADFPGDDVAMLSTGIAAYLVAAGLRDE